MADLSDVEEILATIVSSSLYPDGVGSTSAIEAICRVYRGWPSSSTLNADLLAGQVNVTISPDSNQGRTTTRYTTTWQSSPVDPELAVATTGTTVELSGRVVEGQLIGLLINGKSYVYLPLSEDTLEMDAANLGQAVLVDRSVNVSGTTISVPGANSLLARVVMSTSTFTEIRRQERDMRVIFWCPSPTMRDRAVAAVDLSLGAKYFIALPDGSAGRLSYLGTEVFDQAQNALLYRRDLIYCVEYPTIITQSAPAMLFGDLALNALNLVA